MDLPVQAVESASQGFQRMRHTPSSMKPMSKETQAKGEAFIRALVEEGHDYESMKGSFFYCLMSFGLRQCNGVLDRVAALVNTHRNNLYGICNTLGLDLKKIRAELRAG